MNDPGYTPDEPWTLTVKPGHQYAAAMEFITGTLGDGFGRHVLVIGSPPAEAEALTTRGWRVTYVDWRVAPRGLRVVQRLQGSALQLPCDPKTFTALTSTCVLCHVGMGRYGDPMSPEGESRMLAECRRVLVPDGLAVLMVGPVYDGPCPLTIGTIHRVTTRAALCAMADARDFTVERLRTWRPNPPQWLGRGAALTTDVTTPDYLCAILRAV